jgi:hypothetical protein
MNQNNTIDTGRAGAAALLVTSTFTLSGCQVVKDIFGAGVGVGVFIMLVVVVVGVGAAALFGRK